MGFSARAQAAIFEIEKADDWGLPPHPSSCLMPMRCRQAPRRRLLAELKLDLAILKYARFARGGRFDPLTLSKLLDQAPPLRDPKVVLTEIETAPSPDLYLQSLHPKHEQFARLRQALLKAGEARHDGAQVRHRPRHQEDRHQHGALALDARGSRQAHVWNNSPELMVYVVKDGKPIFADRILVGTLAYATPVFTADMKTIVFNPDWNAPETVVKENLLPPLRDGNLSILKVHKLSVSLNGTPVDPARVDWTG